MNTNEAWAKAAGDREREFKRLQEENKELRAMCVEIAQAKAYACSHCEGRVFECGDCPANKTWKISQNTTKEG